jgi:cell division septum initiation protein DivIVA
VPTGTLPLVQEVPGVVQIPVEVADHAAVFDVVARGYRRSQVDAHLAALEQELAELRWEHDDVRAQRAALAEQRAEQERWVPSFDALGERVVALLRLAEQEAAALRAEAVEQARRTEQEATAGLAERVAEQERAAEQAQRAAERELRALEAGTRTRRELLEGELVRVRRDAELEVAGRLATATARAQDLLAEAARQADEIRGRARAEVAALQRRRDELTREMIDLSERLVAVVHRLDRSDPPLDVNTG